jgi:hypothetical protein
MYDEIYLHFLGSKLRNILKTSDQKQYHRTDDIVNVLQQVRICRLYSFETSGVLHKKIQALEL